MPRVRSQRRPGRPPAADGAETERRILTAARGAFARHGYAGTTNQAVAAAAGVATGTIYHYFESKQDMYLSVRRETDAIVLDRLVQAASRATTLAAQLGEMLEAALTLHAEDDSLARFTAASAADLQRHPELGAAALTEGRPELRAFMARLVAGARARGEVVAPVSDDALLETIGVLLGGLAELAARTSPGALHEVFRATRHLVDGTLLAPAPDPGG